MTPIETMVIKPEVKFLNNDVEYRLIDISTESELDQKVKDIEDYMTFNSGKGKSDDEKNELYSNAKNLWKSFTDSLKEAKYNFYLNREQYRFLTNLITQKLEYDVNTVFFAIELTDMLAIMSTTKYSNDSELIPVHVNTTEITYIYHLISKHKVKGLTKDAYTFSKILIKIGEISKIFNYYDNLNKSLSTKIQDWVTLFEDNVTSDVEKGSVSEPITEK